MKPSASRWGIDWVTIVVIPMHVAQLEGQGAARFSVSGMPTRPEI
jgi:hypothetical protein